VQFGVHAGLSSRRSRVQIPSGPRAEQARKETFEFSVQEHEIAQDEGIISFSISDTCSAGLTSPRTARCS
jgi:hypothetical protein